MKKAVLAGRKRKNFSAIEAALLENSFSVQWTGTGEQALTLISGSSPPADLLVTDETLKDMTGKQLIKKVVMVSPMTNFAAAGSLSHKNFHDEFEGLGVLMQLPLRPGPEDGDALISCLDKIHHLSR